MFGDGSEHDIHALRVVFTRQTTISSVIACVLFLRNEMVMITTENIVLSAAGHVRVMERVSSLAFNMCDASAAGITQMRQ